MLLGNGFGFWNTMPMRRRTSTGSTFGSVEVEAVVDRSGPRPGALDEVVHAVEAAQHGRLAAAGRADERGDLVLADVEVDLADGAEVAVVHGQVARLEHHRTVGATDSCIGGVQVEHRGRVVWWTSALVEFIGSPLSFIAVSQPDGEAVHDQDEDEQHERSRSGDRAEVVARLAGVREDHGGQRRERTGQLLEEALVAR